MPPKTWLLPLFGWVFAFPSCSGGNSAGDDARDELRSSGPPSIIFLTIDTLREDHLSRSGHSRTTTPYLDRLASEGAYFSNCYAQCSWTLPSMLSMFSSIPPAVFGIKDGIRMIPAHRRRIPEGKGARDVLSEYFPDEHLMLPEVLAQHGYFTAGFSTNGHLSVEQGFAQGFAHFDQRSCMWGSAGCVFGAARRWLDAYLDAGKRDPFLLWIHLFDPHFNEFDPKFEGHDDPPVYDPPPGYATLYRAQGAGASALDVEERTRRAYDRRLRYTDDQIREFFEGLRGRGNLDEMLVVVAADHGEEFNEDGRWGHSQSLRNSLIRVPLVLRFPGGRFKGTSDLAVSNLDVAPTMLDFLGIAIPPSMEGQSLLPALRREPFRTTPIYGETRRYDRDLRFLLDPALDRKLVLDLKAGERRLFSMSEDREELRDLSTEEVLRADSLEDSLRSSIREMESRSTLSEVRRSLSDEEVRILRTLGYVK